MSDDFFEDDEESFGSMEDILTKYTSFENGNKDDLLHEYEWELLIDHFDEKQDLLKAIEISKIALEYYPFSSELLIKRADLLIADGDFKYALDFLNKVEVYNPNDINLYVLKMDAFLGLKNTEDASKSFDQAIQIFDGEELVDFLFEAIDVYDDYEDFEKVFDCLVLLLGKVPLDESALYKMCYWTDFTGRYEESITLHQKIIDDYPYCELAWFNLATAYQGIKLYEKAIDCYQYVTAINDKFDFAYRNMADALIRIRKYKEGIEALEKVLELSKPEDVVLEAIGHCYHKLLEFKKARFYYRKAAYLQPEDSKLVYKIALTYIDEDNWAAALKPLEKSVTMYPSAEYKLALGECMLQLERLDDALVYFSEVVQSKPKQSSAWESFLKGLYLAGNFEEMEIAAQEALEVTGRKSIFYFYLAIALFGQNKMKEGYIQLENGMAENPKQFKKIFELTPGLLQNRQIVDILARYKKAKR